MPVESYGVFVGSVRDSLAEHEKGSPHFQIDDSFHYPVTAKLAGRCRPRRRQMPAPHSLQEPVR